MSDSTTIFTIGHSDHDMETFIGLLREHDITVVVDVRSQPYSRWASQFNRETLTEELVAHDIDYRFMGDVLGGRPSDSGLYARGAPDFGRIEETKSYQEGIGRLIDLGRAQRVAVMCSEGDYRECHRHHLIAQTLLRREVRVVHIKP